MKTLQAVCIVVALPLLVVWLFAMPFPVEHRVYAAVVAFFPSTFVSISIASEVADGRISSLRDAYAAVVDGGNAFLLWTACMSVIFVCIGLMLIAL
ncbi:hypothetical protein SAMN05216229_1236 [Geopseudomonas sagittaria]|uniref:Uncharacterized protein n=1 Tax=Geopseudomonas sagittaria TaxID=1135990 RepID=A0A1I5YN85_9GAMM|nr:hypothetical protein [Pseudomonas sagittaria]SFQ45709.1 hypothetical protein SAMN05216229_1236 [Pseudomonas sagittaria]